MAIQAKIFFHQNVIRKEDETVQAGKEGRYSTDLQEEEGHWSNQAINCYLISTGDQVSELFQ